MMSSSVMMAEAVAVRPSPDMSATCKVRLYTETTWGHSDRGQDTQVERRARLVGHLRAWGEGHAYSRRLQLLSCSQALEQNRLPVLSGLDGTTADPRLCPSL